MGVRRAHRSECQVGRVVCGVVWGEVRGWTELGLRLVAVTVVDGETLHVTKVSRLHMGAYLCIASNSVPPSISKRVFLRVQCE